MVLAKFSIQGICLCKLTSSFFVSARTCQLKQNLHYSYPPQYVVEVGHNHKQEQDAYADVFGPDHKVLAGLAARNHFVQQEQHVAAIKGRNG